MIPLFKPYMPEELPELQNILQSGNLSYGKWGKNFEKLLAEFLGNPLVLTTNSYNSAFLVAITTLGLKCGDSIIASPMSCLASNQPFATLGINIIWADIDPKTGTLDPEDVRKKIDTTTKAIVHNHFCGYAGYVNEIECIAKESGLFLIDDAIEAFGTRYQNKLIGTLEADITVFSFQTVRLPNTIDGGGLTFKSIELYNKATLVRDYGIDRPRFRDQLGEISKTCDITIAGYGALLSEPNSYIGCQQMSLIDGLLKSQQTNAAAYHSQFSLTEGMDVLTPIPNSRPNYWVYGLLANDKVNKIQEFRANGMYASGVHLNNNSYSVFGIQPILKGVEEFSQRFIAIPCGWWINQY